MIPRPFTYGANGVAFKNGKLYLFRFRRETKRRPMAGSVSAIRPWGARAGCWVRTDKQPAWQQVRPELGLASRTVSVAGCKTQFPGGAGSADDGSDCESSPQLAAEGRAYDSFLASIPAEAAALASGFGERQWHALQLLNRVGQFAFELTRDCPALAAMIASSWVFRKRLHWQMRAARRLCRVRRHDAVGWLGFPSSRSVVRLLKKIPAADVSVQGLLYLRDCLRENDPQAVKALQHCRRLPRPVLRIVTDPCLQPFAGPQLLSDLAENQASALRWPGSAPEMMRDTLVYWQQAFPERCVRGVFRSASVLGAAHEEMILESRIGRDILGRKLPPPPLPGTDQIKPLETMNEVYQESLDMHHCLFAAYSGRIAIGAYYAYSLTGAERATIGLKRVAGGWAIDQVQGPCNEPVSLRAMDRVLDWIGQPAAGERVAASAWDPVAAF